jgi:hypothetical protein
LSDRPEHGSTVGDDRRDTRLIGLFVLGLVAFSPVFLQIFGRPVALFGLPLLYIYVFAAWALLIGLVAYHAEGRGRAGDGRPSVQPEDEP